MARYETETKDAILQRMKSNSPEDIDQRQGSITHDLLSPASIELAQAYIELDNVLAFGFVSEDIPSEFLDKRCSELGLYRKLATKATGQVTFTGDAGVVIPSGSRLSTDEQNPKYFLTTAEGTVGTDGTVTVNAEAEQAGTAGNVAANKIVLVLTDLSGVASVTNAAAFEGGTDDETDSALLQRYYDKVRRPATSGNANHYISWAKEVSGVSDAKCYPTWNGNGTVKVVLLGDDKTAPSQTVVDSTTTHIEDKRPVGATVTVVGATEVAINISATLTLASGSTTTDAQTEIETAVTSYLADLAFNDTVVRYSQIGSIILDCESVLDYDALTVNEGSANIQVADDEVAVLGTVTV